MKKSGLILSILFLILVSSVIGAHTATVSLLGYNPNYETNNMKFKLQVSNDDTSVNSITNVTLSYPGYSKTYIMPLPSWQYYGDIDWYNGLISALGSQTFVFNATAQQVNADTPFTWVVTTRDTSGFTQVNNLPVITILNDSNSPTITNILPINYSFVKNDTINFTITVSEAETSISGSPSIGYRDSPMRVDSGTVNAVLNLIKSSDNVYTILWNPLQTLQPYIDYRIVGLTDAVGNNYDEGDNLFHHLYIDNQKPIIILNQLTDNFLTNNQNQVFNFDASDNSFVTLSQGFLPTLDCSLYINGVNSASTVLLSNTSNILFNINLALSDGTYPWYVTCVDKAGWITQSETRNIILDTTGPVINLISPANNSIILNGTNILISVTDSPAGVSSIWFDNGIVNTTITTTIDTSTWNEGINNIIIYSNDTLDNIASKSITFIIDKTPPVISGLSPANETITKNNVNIGYTATDNFSPIINCKLYIDNIFNESLVSNSGNAVATIKSLGEGSHTWYLNCTDSVGLSSVSEIRTVTIDTTPPTVDLSSFNLLNNTNDDDGNINLPYTVSDPSGVNNCSLYINGILDQTSTVPPFTNFLLTIVHSNSAYNISISCTDSIGNLFNSPTIEIYYDDIAPLISGITESIGSDTATIIWNTNEFANGSSVSYTNNISGIIYSANEGSPATLVTLHTLTLPSLTALTAYYYQIFSVDKWGNIGNSSVTFFTTTAAPPAGSTGGGGGGSSSGGSGTTIPVCTDEHFTCTAWGECQGNLKIGSQLRTCTLKEGIECTGDYKPISLRDCALTPIETPSAEPTGILPGLTSITGRSIYDELKSTPMQALLVSLFVLLIIAVVYRYLRQPKYPDTIIIDE